MSTPLRLIGSPRNVVQAKNLTPSTRFLNLSGGDPWTPDSLRPLADKNNPVTSCIGSSPQNGTGVERSELLDFQKQGIKSSYKTKGVRRLPWSDGGKHAHKYSICKQEMLAEPLPLNFIKQEKPTVHYPSVNTPDRGEILRNLQCGQKVHNVLGKGTFGTVFIASYHGSLVAGKIPSPHPKASQQLKNELHGVGLKHPNIVSLIKVVQPAHHQMHGILIMEHVSGYSLQKLIDLGSAPKCLMKRAKYSLHIAKALEYCHSQGILHLDVKPKNIIVCVLSDTCKLCDFGCSSLIGSNTLSVQGTVQYVAPEVLRGETPTPAADVYSLSITMWQLTSGETPYEGEGNHTIIYKVVAKEYRPDLPPSPSADEGVYFSLIKMCWHQAPQSRIKVEKLICELNVLLRGCKT